MLELQEMAFAEFNISNPPMNHDYVLASVTTMASIHNYSRSQTFRVGTPPKDFLNLRSCHESIGGNLESISKNVESTFG